MDDLTSRQQPVARDTNVLSNDTVSRQAAIDAVESAKTARTPDGEIYVAKLNAEMNIQVLSSAQPEIIRCKDCKYYQFADNRAFGMPVKMCKWFGFEDVEDDDFCSRAERRTDENNNE